LSGKRWWRISPSDEKIIPIPTSYREVEINGKLYCVTGVFTGEKQLGATLEKLAAQHILNDLDRRSRSLFRAQ